ncbi:Crp/Fnr family transcriptional regulator [Nitrincola alkalilacustris]|uniref:Crp/Fnr family transcriptional regulator n=1 Tax=Nitrincola alkalilacustris TaxID=1571224 RepID=UPI00124CB91B|nr:Crp/Fnr family transcriptional regulator [Nitrincola alkalilacustris]
MIFCPTQISAGKCIEVEQPDQHQPGEQTKCRDNCLIRQHSLFCCLNDDSFTTLISQARSIRFAAHQMIYREGEAASRFYLLLEGCVKLFRPTADGSERVIDAIQSYHTLGETDIFCQTHCYSCFAETLQPSHVISFPAAAYRELVAEDKQSSEKLINYFAESLKRKNFDLEVMINCAARERVIIYVRQLLSDMNATTQLHNKAVVHLPMAKCQVAARLAMKPETFSRILADLKLEGLLDVVRSNILIADVSRFMRETD